MIKKIKILDLLEAHLDKIVLGVIGLISLYLLWTFVVGNPYGAEAYGRKVSPGQIDLKNQQQAQVLQSSVEDSAEPITYDQQLVVEFEELLRSSLPTLAVDLSMPIPGIGEQVFDDDRFYPTPEIVALADVQVASLRGAVHKPTEEVSPETPYRDVLTELGDLDLVTVSGRIDVATLYRNFQQSFMGPRLNATWREPTFARPVIARLELQRRLKLPDGSWSEWSVIPRTQIDAFRKLIEQTPMTTEEMEFGGVMLWIKQYEDPRVQISLLQPEAYDFASTLTEWLPPKFLDEAQTIFKRQSEEQRRQLREERLRARETGGNEAIPFPGGRQPGRDTRPQPQRPQPTRTQPQPRERGGQRDRDIMPAVIQDPAAIRPPVAGTATRREKTIDDVLKDMQQERINEQTKLDTRRDSLLVWAHDDTTLAGQTYQYRIRLGVFNPIAGRNWFSDEQQRYKNQVVLWSQYSEPTQEVTIPKMMHVFPTDVLALDTGGGVKVEVARYYLGQWRTHEFEVFPGQIIGQKADYTPVYLKTAGTETIPGRGGVAEVLIAPIAGAMGMTAASGAEPKTVDFTTPFMLVDVNTRVDWGSNFSSRSEYWQMLYFGTEQTIQTIPVGRGNWSAEIRRERDEIKDAEQNAIPLNPTRSSTPGMFPGDFGRPRTPAGAPIMPLPIMMPEGF